MEMTYKQAVIIAKAGIHGRIQKKIRRVILDREEPFVACSAVGTVRQMENGEQVECSRYHCAREHHFPNAYGQRIPVLYESDPNFQVPKCPWCGEKLEKGGCPDIKGIVIHGPA